MGRSKPVARWLIAGTILVAGCQGSTAASGSAGSAGADGTAGITASAGTTGAAGVSSSAGSPGIGGAAGTAGPVGAGVSGTDGTQSAAGTAGAAGATGAAGMSGLAGTTGSAGASEPGGSSGSGGADAIGGVGGTGVAGGSGGVGGIGGAPCVGQSGGPTGGIAGAASALPTFSFFVTSLRAMRVLSGSEDGFGGDLRFGEVGPGAGLRGADKICATVAETSMPGAGAKGWRAFLSATSDGCSGGVVNAIDRIGSGPWYDRIGRLVAANREALVSTRPEGADPVIINDLPNEDGVPNHTDGRPGCVRDGCPDNHDVLTGSTATGTLWNPGFGNTCNDWTSAAGPTGRPMLGHSWPASSGMSWMEAHTAQGCAPGVHLDPGTLPTTPRTVGFGGGYGGIYCFALTP